jgi:alpha-D-ribose 1-methylphosphonate 5-triphosphate synthase subunit PhnG
MNRRRRTYILIEGDPALRSRLAREITDNHECIELDPPNHGLTMIKMRESARRTLFYLGEMLVTEAKVQVGAYVGLGLISGDRPKAAGDLAIIDAAYKAGLDETVGWEKRLLAEEERIEMRRSQEDASILETRVRFETMDVD